MSQAQDFVTAFMEQLAGSATLNETLKGVFASILEKQVSVSAENEVSFGSSFSVLAQVFTFIATPEADRPSEGILGYGDAAIDQAKTDAATDQGLTVGGDITPATFSMSASATEAEEGKELTFTITASTPVTEDTAVTFQIVTDGKDAGDEDFQQSQLSQTATILAGETTATFSVNPQRDGLNEDSESFGVSATVAGETFTADATILDVDSKEFVLTTDRDVETANIFYASQTQFNVDGKGPTLQSNDILTGFADEDDNKLVVTDLTPGVTNSNLPTGLQLNNIQTVELNATGNTAASGFSTVPHASVTELTANTDGAGSDVYLANNANSGTETTVNVNHTSVTGSTTVSGGHDVTVMTNGSGVVVGNQGSGTVPTSAQVATGDVTITNGNTGGGAVQVFGGDNITINTTSNSSSGAIDVGNTATNTGAGNSAAGGLANASGDIQITTKGTGAITAFGGSDVTIDQDVLAGALAITIGDSSYNESSNIASGDITVNQASAITYNGLAGSSNNDTESGSITIAGGVNVDVTTNNANVITIGDQVTTGETALNPTGTITVTNTGTETNGVGAANGTINIAGGTDVTVETTGSNVTIGAGANNNLASNNPTGNVEVTETMNGAGFQRAVAIDGGQDVTVNAKGQTVTIGANAATGSAATGAIVVNQDDVFTGNTNAVLNGTNAGDIVANGGTTVDITTTGGNVTVGATVGSEKRVASDAITINNTFGGEGADTVTVAGGTTVDITTTQTSGAISVGANSAALTAAGDALKDSELAPTGNVTIVNKTVSGSATAYGNGQVDVLTNGADTVSVTGGDTDSITDIQSTLATGGSNAGKAVGTSTLATVVLDALQSNDGATIQSDALTSLTLKNTTTAGNTITITNNTDAHALTITQSNNTAAAAGTTNVVTDNKAGSLTITDDGTASAATLQVNASKATSATVNNAAAAVLQLGNAATDIATVTLTGAGSTTFASTDVFGAGNLNKALSVDASGATGDVKLSMQMTTTTGQAQSYKGGSGTDTVTINSNASGWGNLASIAGGAGDADVLVANYAAAGTDVALGNASSISGFETLGLGSAATGSYDASGFNTVQLGAVAGAVTLTSAASGVTLSLQDNTGAAATVAVTGANTTATNNSMTVNLGKASSSDAANQGTNIGAATGAVTLGGIETLAINSTGGDLAAGNVVTINNIASDGSQDLDISGDRKLTLTSTDGNVVDVDVTSTNAVDLSATDLSNAAVSLTGGAGKLTAVGSNNTDNFSALVSLTGTGATPIGNGETVIVTVSNADGTNAGTYTYTNSTGGDVSLATAASSLAAAINAGGAGPTGSTAHSGIVGGGNAGVTATVSGSNIVLQGAAAFEIETGEGDADDNADVTISDTILGGQQQFVLTLGGLVDDSGPVTDADLTVQFAGVGATAIQATGIADDDTAKQVADKLVAAFNATASANKQHISSAVAVDDGGGVARVIFTVQAGQVSQMTLTNTVANWDGTGAAAPTDSTAFNMATVANSVESGAGGVDYTLGLGGSWDTVTSGFSAGSETVNLTASEAKADTLQANDGAVSTYNGANGGVTKFVVDSQSASDKITFATAGKTIVANAVTSTVNSVTGASTMAGKLDSSGSLITKLANLTYSISNGVVTFGATGGHSLSEFTSGELISAAQILVSSATTGGVNQVLAFSSNGHSYVVASDNDVTNELQDGTGNKSIIIDLVDVADVKGFGSTFGEATIVATNVTNRTDATDDLAALATSSTLDYAGFAIATLAVSGTAAANTNTTVYNNLASSAVLDIDGAAGNNDHMGVITTNQVGTSGHNSLTVDMGTNVSFIDSLTANGTAQVNVTAAAGLQTISKLVDGTNTMNTVGVAGTSAVTIGEITSTALTNVIASGAGGAFTLGSSGTAIAQNDLRIDVADGQSSSLFTSGTGVTFTQNAATNNGTGAVTIAATGANNTITLDNGNNSVTASGANSVITVGTGTNTISATGSDVTVNIASGDGAALRTGDTAANPADGVTTLTVGSNATVNIGSVDKAGNAIQINANDVIDVSSAATGGDSSGFAHTTINFASGVSASVVIDLKNAVAATDAAVVYSMLGNTAGSAVDSQVNVQSASSLAEALDLAANYELLASTQGTAAATLGMNTGKISWFQYEGNTYVVGMVNDTNVAVQQNGLDSNDVVVKLTGLVDLTGATYNAGAEQLTI